MDLLRLVILDYELKAADCSKKLEYEESGTLLAMLQGSLKGCKLFLGTFRKEFSSNGIYEIDDLEFQTIPPMDSLTDRQICTLEKHRQELSDSPDWEEFLQIFDRHIEQKKEWLFSTADKGRDLVSVHGWRDAMKRHEELFNAVEREYDFRLEHKSLFEDDLDVENIEPESIFLPDSNVLYLPAVKKEDVEDAEIIEGDEPEEKKEDE